MRPYELKKYIFDNEKIEFVLESIGVHNIKERINEFRGATPDYEGSNNLSVRKNEFLSVAIYTSNETVIGDIFVLLEHIKEFTFFESLKYLHKLFDLSMQQTRNVKESNDEITRLMSVIKQYDTESIRDEAMGEQKTYDESFLKDKIKLPYAEFFKEGILAVSQERFGVRFDPLSGRVVFPWTYSWDNEEVRYVGAMARTTVKEYKELGIHKYMAIPVNFSKTRNLYGYIENYTGIQKAGKVIVFEGEKSVIKADSYGYQCAVAVGGHDISNEQRVLLESLNVEIIIAFDKDINEDFLKSVASRMSKGRVVSYIYDCDNLLSDKDSPVDKGRAVFGKLLDERKVMRY